MKIAQPTTTSSYFYLITPIKSQKPNQQRHQQRMRTHLAPAVTPLPPMTQGIDVGPDFKTWVTSSRGSATASLYQWSAELQRVSPLTRYFFLMLWTGEVPFCRADSTYPRLKDSAEAKYRKTSEEWAVCGLTTHFYQGCIWAWFYSVVQPFLGEKLCFPGCESGRRISPKNEGSPLGNTCQKRGCDSAQEADIHCWTPARSADSVYIDHASPKTAPSPTTMNWKSFKGLKNKEKIVCQII